MKSIFRLVLLTITLFQLCTTLLAELNTPYNAIEHQFIVLVDDSFLSPISTQSLEDYIITTLEEFGDIVVFNSFDFGYFAFTRLENAWNSLGGGLKGFVLKIGTADMMTQLRSMKGVVYVEQDQVVWSTAAIEFERSGSKLREQINSTWNLARVSSHTNGAHNYRYNPNGGNGVDVYVVDTGVDITHPEFEGRAIWDKTVPKGDFSLDKNGHGTHVGATIGGKTYGIAKAATIHAVKVLSSDGSGSLSDVMLGIEYVIGQHKKSTNKKSVINMSLGAQRSKVMDQAVRQAVKAGVHVVVAAGNSYDDACDYSPAASEYAITVAASDINDALADFSNYGSCVDIIAPGKDITSAWIGKMTERTISGTSMASPHVAGVVALILSANDGDKTPQEIKDIILKMSTKGVVSQLSAKTPNRLLYSLKD